MNKTIEEKVRAEAEKRFPIPASTPTAIEMKQLLYNPERQKSFTEGAEFHSTLNDSVAVEFVNWLERSDWARIPFMDNFWQNVNDPSYTKSEAYANTPHATTAELYQLFLTQREQQ